MNLQFHTLPPFSHIVFDQSNYFNEWRLIIVKNRAYMEPKGQEREQSDILFPNPQAQEKTMSPGSTTTKKMLSITKMLCYHQWHPHSLKGK